MDGLIEGRIVHYVMKDGQHRPAMVARAWRHMDYTTTPPTEGETSGCVNLVVTIDGTNDQGQIPQGDPAWLNAFWMDAERKRHDCVQFPLQVWATSVAYSEDKTPGTWHWIERA